MRNKNLKNKLVLTHVKSILGIDQIIFWPLMVVSIATIALVFYYFPFYIAIPSSLIFSFIAFAPTYIVHKTDPRAWVSYSNLVFGATSLISSEYKDNQVIIFKDNL